MGRDGQEIDPTAGSQLCLLIDSYQAPENRPAPLRLDPTCAEAPLSRSSVTAATLASSTTKTSSRRDVMGSSKDQPVGTEDSRPTPGLAEQLAAVASFLKRGDVSSNSSATSATPAAVATATVSQTQTVTDQLAQAAPAPASRTRSSTAVETDDRNVDKRQRIHPVKVAHITWNFDWVEKEILDNPLLAIFPVDLTAIETYAQYERLYANSKAAWEELENTYGADQIPRLPSSVTIPPEQLPSFSATVLVEMLARSAPQETVDKLLEPFMASYVATQSNLTHCTPVGDDLGVAAPLPASPSSLPYPNNDSPSHYSLSRPLPVLYTHNSPPTEPSVEVYSNYPELMPPNMQSASSLKYTETSVEPPSSVHYTEGVYRHHDATTYSNNCHPSPAALRSSHSVSIPHNALLPTATKPHSSSAGTRSVYNEPPHRERHQRHRSPLSVSRTSSTHTARSHDETSCTKTGSPRYERSRERRRDGSSSSCYSRRRAAQPQFSDCSYDRRKNKSSPNDPYSEERYHREGRHKTSASQGNKLYRRPLESEETVRMSPLNSLRNHSYRRGEPRDDKPFSDQKSNRRAGHEPRYPAPPLSSHKTRAYDDSPHRPVSRHPS